MTIGAETSSGLTVSVVMATYHRADRISRAIEAVSLDPQVHEIIIVVDGPDAATEARIAEAAHVDSRVRAVIAGHGGQFRALQAGTEAASGDVVVFLDDDVLAGPGLATAHGRYHERSTGLVVLGYMPVLLSAPRRSTDVAAYLYAEAYEWHCDQFEKDQSLILDGFWAGNFSMRRTDALRVGFVDPGRDLHYREDRVFGSRCRDAGLQGAFHRDLRATHIHSHNLDAFLRDAVSAGRGDVVHDLDHPSPSHPLTADDYLRALPKSSRILVLACRFKTARAVIVPAVIGLIRGAGALRQWKVQDVAALTARHGLELASADATRRQLTQQPLARR